MKRGVTVQLKLDTLDAVIKQYVAPRLVIPRLGHGSIYGWLNVSITVKRCRAPSYCLEIEARHGYMADNLHGSAYPFYSLDQMTARTLTTALFNALSWPGSPYFWDGKRWDKQIEVAG